MSTGGEGDPMTRDEMTRLVRIEQELLNLSKVVNQMALSFDKWTAALNAAIPILQGAAKTQAALTTCQAALTQAQTDETAAQTQLDAGADQLSAAAAPPAEPAA